MEMNRDKTVSRAQATWALSARIAALARLKALEAALPADLPGAWDFAFTPDGEVQFGVTLASRAELALWVRALRRLPGVTAGRCWIAPNRRHVVHPFCWGGAALCLAVPNAPASAAAQQPAFAAEQRQTFAAEQRQTPSEDGVSPLPVWAAYIETLDFDKENGRE